MPPEAAELTVDKPLLQFFPTEVGHASGGQGFVSPRNLASKNHFHLGRLYMSITAPITLGNLPRPGPVL